MEGGWGGGVTLLKQDTNRIILHHTMKPACVHVCTVYFTFYTLSTSGRIMHHSVETLAPLSLGLGGVFNISLVLKHHSFFHFLGQVVC